jgi:parallel beta-helix repeat protein
MSLAIFDPTMASSTLRSSVADSVIAQNWMRGIDGTYMPRLDVTNNQVTDTGMVDHSGVTDTAIAVSEAGNVTGNVIKNAAFEGIMFSGTGGTVIQNNYIAGYCARLSDCAAIYTWNGPKALRRTTNQSSFIRGNQVLGATPNMWGAGGQPGADLVAGIYLDDYSMNSTIDGNWVSEMPVGIFLHNTSGTTVNHNAVWLNSRVGLWASMDQKDADYMTGNVFSDNEIVRTATASGNYPALPTLNASNPIWFFHALYGAGSLSSGSNVFSANRHVEINGVTTGEALVRDGVGELYYTAASWRALNPNEGALQTPLTFATNVPVTGPELVPRSVFTSTFDSWGWYFNVASPKGTASFFNSVDACKAGCGQLVARTGGDLLASAPFSMTPGIPHIYSYTAYYSGAATVAAPYIGRNGAPYDHFEDSSGFSTISSRYGTAGSTVHYEAFFRPKSSEQARVNLQLQTMGVPVSFTNVSVKAVTGFNFSSPSDWARVANAPHDAALSVTCATLGWPAGCTIADTQGNAVAQPYSVPAGTSRIFYRGDSSWRR